MVLEGHLDDVFDLSLKLQQLFRKRVWILRYIRIFYNFESVAFDVGLHAFVDRVDA